MYSGGVGNVHHERHEALTELCLQTIGVSLLAYRTEHAKSLRSKHLCGSPTNSGGDPGDHNIFAVRHSISPKMITVHLQRGHCTLSLLKLSRCIVFLMPYPSKTDRQTILSAAVKDLAHGGIRDLSIRNLAASLNL